MSTPIAAAQLNLVVDGTDYVLMHSISMTLEQESETKELRGTHLTLQPVQALYSYQSNTTYKLTIEAEYMSQVFSDLIEFNIIKRATTTEAITGYKTLTTAASGNTTVTLPAGAVAKTVLYTDLGMEATLISPANFDTTNPAAPVISNVLNKNVVVIYELEAEVETAAANLGTEYKPMSLIYSASGKTRDPFGNVEEIKIPAMTLAAAPTQTFVNGGDVEAASIEFTVLNTTGTPYSRHKLSNATVTALGL